MSPSRVPPELKEQVQRRLAAAAEDVFNLLEKTLREHEDELQRRLLQPRVWLCRTEPPDELQDKAVQHPRVKEERDVICIRQDTENSAPPAEREEAQTTARPAGGALHCCSVCGKGFRWRGNLQRHLLVHTGQSRFHCPVCNKAYSRQDTLRLHMRRHRPFSRSVATKTSRGHKKEKQPKAEGEELQTAVHRPAPTRSNKRRAKSMQRRFCAFCCKAFRCNAELLEHMRVHSGERPFSCSDCDKTFTTRRNLRRHSAVHSTVTERPFSCSDSASTERPFSCSDSASTERPFSCSDTASTENPFSCSDSASTEKPFSCSDTASKEKPFSCSDSASTEKPFSCSDSASTERPFSCSDSASTERPFSCSDSASTERPFSCSDCDKTFTTSWNLKRHSVSHLANPFSCSEPASTEKPFSSSDSASDNC